MDNLDLDRAVSAGILRAEQADALRRFEEEQRGAPAATEEQFALVSGFADVMAAVGILLTAGTTSAMIAPAHPWAALVIPVAAWVAAGYFTNRRRMMLTSILLFVIFILPVALGAMTLTAGGSASMAVYRDMSGFALTATGALTAVGCFAWWRSFRLPLAVAAGSVAALNAALQLARWILPDLGDELALASVLLGGPVIFVVAMLWDMSDVRRETIRSNVAFWLHLVAGYLLVQGAMVMILGARTGQGVPGMVEPLGSIEGSGQALAVLATLFLFALVALAIDRRSLLTAGMFFFVKALANLLGDGQGPAVALLIAGLLLTVLAVRWVPLRRKLLHRLPDRLAAQLPRAQIEVFGPRPVR